MARDKGTRLTIDDLEEPIKNQSRIGKGAKVSNNLQGKDFVLSRFQGKCYKCKQTGHKENKCQNVEGDIRNNGGGNKFTGQCNFCGKTGHKADKC